MLMAGPVRVATCDSWDVPCEQIWCVDMGVRTDVVKVAVEDMAVNLGWAGNSPEETSSVSPKMPAPQNLMDS
ncbi:hypothetical protein IFM89_031119 [Coptis chinensis]|uniref:Uncharacterized protein n=1 Tax=Coptis chinensis TaxID=261450 RepID=A0A835MFX8_9MAGN|nr:hypothetical protein IFM89_031119 [Coptis chinensis]